MPTKKKRVNEVPINLEPKTKPEEICPSRYTGNKIFDKDPAKYARIVCALGEQKPMTRIAREEKVSPETVVAICSREKESIKAVNELTAGLVSYAAQACVIQLLEKLEADEIPAGVLPIATGIMIDKARAYQGEASTIIEHRKTVTIEDVKDELARMKQDAIDVQVKETKTKDPGPFHKSDASPKEE